MFSNRMNCSRQTLSLPPLRTLKGRWDNLPLTVPIELLAVPAGKASRNLLRRSFIAFTEQSLHGFAHPTKNQPLTSQLLLEIFWSRLHGSQRHDIVPSAKLGSKKVKEMPGTQEIAWIIDKHGLS